MVEVTKHGRLRHWHYSYNRNV